MVYIESKFLQIKYFWNYRYEQDQTYVRVSSDWNDCQLKSVYSDHSLSTYWSELSDYIITLSDQSDQFFR